MTTQISGTTGCSQVQAGSINQDDLAANVVGKGPAFRAYQTTASSVGVVLVKIPLQAELFDTNNAFDAAVNSRFQPLVAGYYQINAAIQFDTSNYSVRAILFKNGAVYSYSAAPAAGYAVGVSDIVYLNGTTDYLELFGYSSTTQNSVPGADRTYLSGFLVRAA